LPFTQEEEVMEFILLLILSLVISIVASLLVIMFFRKPVDKIFARVIGEEIASAWRKFLMFALFVVGVSSGVNIWRLEKFIEPVAEGAEQIHLSAERWGLEIFWSVMGTLGGLAWALLVFFVVALIAFVIVKRGEAKARA